MEFIKNEKEREKTFFKLWNEEVNINPQNYRFIFGNDIQFFRGITQEELEKIFEFCNKYHKLFKYCYHNYLISIFLPFTTFYFLK